MVRVAAGMTPRLMVATPYHTVRRRAGESELQTAERRRQLEQSRQVEGEGVGGADGGVRATAMSPRAAGSSRFEAIRSKAREAASSSRLGRCGTSL